MGHTLQLIDYGAGGLHGLEGTPFAATRDQRQHLARLDRLALVEGALRDHLPEVGHLRVAVSMSMSGGRDGIAFSHGVDAQFTLLEPKRGDDLPDAAARALSAIGSDAVVVVRSGAAQRARWSPTDAAFHRDREGMERALLAGGDPQVAAVGRSDGRTALHWAAAHGDEALIALLLAHGARVEAEADFAVRALHLASESGSSAAVRRLLLAGANPRPRNEVGDRPIHFAARRGCSDAIAALVEGGARVDDLDRSCETALHYAARRGDAALTELLLELGASGRIRNRKRALPWHLARRGGHDALVTVLRGEVMGGAGDG